MPRRPSAARGWFTAAAWPVGVTLTSWDYMWREIWKWIDSGEVEFRVHAVARPAAISNPFVRVGFLLLGRHERRLFLDSTSRRMLAFTELGARHEDGAGAVERAGPELTARRLPDGDRSHERLASKLKDPDRG